MAPSNQTPADGFAPHIGRSISLDHAAQFLGVSRRTIYNRIREGRLRTVRTIGGSQRVLLDSVEQLQAQMRAALPPPRTDKRGSVVGALALVLWCAAAAAPADAQPRAHRARLSADLADHLAAGSQTINVIVHGDKATVDALATRYNLTVGRHLRSGGVLRVTAGQLAALQADDTVDHLSGDIRLRSTADVTAESIGADQVWAGVGDLPALSGAGVGVAVIDSGIDTRHSALRNRVVASVDFTGGSGGDLYGHGTHVASVIAGQIGRTFDTREYQGIASGAHLIDLRALDDDGSGYASDVIEAIDWAIAHRRQFNIRVINLSLGGPVLQPFRDDPLCEAVERAVRVGIVVVAAAGNFGKTEDGKVVYGGITSPANSPYAIAVGAVDTHGTPQRSDDTIASYSSRGPTRYDLIIKPDLSAPGSHIAGAEAAGSYLALSHPERHVTGSGANAYIQLSGTSQAAAVTSGAVALLLDARSNLQPGETKAVLQLTSSFVVSTGVLTAGAGSLNVLAAAHFVESNLRGLLPATEISGEPSTPSGVLTTYSPTGQQLLAGQSINWSGSKVRSSSVVWSGSIIRSDSAVRSVSVAWPSLPVGGSRMLYMNGSGFSPGSHIRSGSLFGDDSIVWSGSLFGDDSIVWSGSLFGDDSIVWSGSVED